MRLESFDNSAAERETRGIYRTLLTDDLLVKDIQLGEWRKKSVGRANGPRAAT